MTPGGSPVSDPRLSSRRIAIDTIAMTPTMIPVPNTRAIPMATVTMMRSMTPSRTSAGRCRRRRDRILPFSGPGANSTDQVAGRPLSAADLPP